MVKWIMNTPMIVNEELVDLLVDSGMERAIEGLTVRLLDLFFASQII